MSMELGWKSRTFKDDLLESQLALDKIAAKG